jgi:hypothetical protein
MGLIMSHVPTTFEMAGLSASFHALFLENLQWMENRHLRIALRVVLQSLVLHCPLQPQVYHRYIRSIYTFYLYVLSRLFIYAIYLCYLSIL